MDCVCVFSDPINIHRDGAKGEEALMRTTHNGGGLGLVKLFLQASDAQ